MTRLPLALQDFGKPAGYIDRQFATWTRQYRASQTEDLAEMEFLMAPILKMRWDAGLAGGQCVIHGDFRLDNMLLQNGIHIRALN